MKISAELALNNARTQLALMRSAPDRRALAYRFAVARGYIDALHDFAVIDAQQWRQLLDEADALRLEADTALHSLPVTHLPLGRSVAEPSPAQVA
ncbi:MULTISPECIES: hypothetical protein [Pseudomonadaceae]|uniref:Uncharacterized protein n=1 Tax=Metapseudomonas otitidis TaxID=319939 RepID=A0A679GC16_9GAMM|nr:MULTISPECIES: hypothetical protein [Pseudomonas]KIV71531.1 hypothetical protein SZ55_2354 [Pseudomonas sp. FeS53a]BCA28246.1 hypothetical protein PtoMrB4_22230 [Pseudomonas otitidis]